MTKLWEEHRDYIVRLYKTEDLTLNVVREKLKRERNFDASIRSYRTHFRKWGVRKYKKRPKDPHHYRRHHHHDSHHDPDGDQRGPRGYLGSGGGSRPLPHPGPPSETWSTASSSASYPQGTGWDHGGGGGPTPFIDVVSPPPSAATARQPAGFYDGGLTTRHLAIPPLGPQQHSRFLPYPETVDFGFPSPQSWRDTDRSPSISGASDISSSPAYDYTQPTIRGFEQHLPVPQLPHQLPPINGGRPVTPESAFGDSDQGQGQGRGLPGSHSWAPWPATDKKYWACPPKD